MKKQYARSFTVFTAFFLMIFLGNHPTDARETWREKVKERMRERRSQRIEKKQTMLDTAGDFDLSLTYDGLTRTYAVHVPSSYNRATPAPLVFAFHGGGGNSAIMVDDNVYHLKSKSDHEGFIIVFPNGASQLRSGKIATWNAGRCCGYARDQNIDDVGFVRAMITDLEQKLNVNKDRIYALGFSNGGMMSYRLACEMSGIFSAVAAVSGTENYDSCAPSEPISVLHIHAKDDGHVLFKGGYGQGAFKDPSKVTDFTSVPETIARWVKRDQCGDTPERVLDIKGAYCELYSDCAGGSSVQLCVTEDGAHSWPGGEKPRAKSDQPSNAINATDIIFDFFKNHEK